MFGKIFQFFNIKRGKRISKTSFNASMAIVMAVSDAMGGKSGLLRSEADLPFPKQVIKDALKVIYCDPRSTAIRNSIEVCYLTLADFRPKDEWERAKKGSYLFGGLDEEAIKKMPIEQTRNLIGELQENDALGGYTVILGRANEEMEVLMKELQDLKSEMSLGAT